MHICASKLKSTYTFCDLFVRDTIIMLCRDKHSVHAHSGKVAIVLAVFDSDL